MIRFAGVVSLFLFSLLIVVPAPTYTLWMLEIVATELGHFVGLAALVLLIPGRRRDRLSVISAGLAVATIAVASSPLGRAYQIASTLPGRLDIAFGPAGTRSSPRAPVSFRSLVQIPASAEVRVRVVNYAAGRPGTLLQLDLYEIPARSTRRPLIIVVHGGSWQGGNRRDLPDLNYYLAARGYTVAAISYRFAPQFPDPAATQDLNAAIDYLKLNSALLGLDGSRIALVGRSAGGHLALLSAYAKRDPAIRGVVAFYPPSDQVYGYDNPSRVIPSRQILESYLSGTPRSRPLVYARNSPISYVSSETVPTLLIHGTRDELVAVRQSRMLAARLAAAGRPHLLVELPWATHGCDYFFNGPCGQVSTYSIERFLGAVMSTK